MTEEGQPNYINYESGQNIIVPNLQTEPAGMETEYDEEITVSAKEQRTKELQDSFSYDGYQVVRKELFAHLREPAVTIRHDSITFNTACIAGLEDVVYVHVMFNKDLKRIVVEGCSADDKDALRWCIDKPDKRKSRRMSCRPFAGLVYKEMGWDKNYRYKMLGYRIEFEGKTMYVFDLMVPEVFHESKRKSKVTSTEYIVQSVNQKEEQVDTRKGFYPDDIAGSFGVPVEEHRKEVEITGNEECVSMAMLTGSKTKETGHEPELEPTGSAPI